MQRLAPLWEAVVEHNRAEYPDIYTDARVKPMLRWLRDVRTHWEALGTAPLTLVHNDFNTRNVCLRAAGERGPARLCVFDWELATIHAPQRDVCELLAWVLPPSEPMETRDRFVEYFRGRLEAHSGRALPKDEFRDVHALACMDYALTRLGMYTVAHGFRAFDWLRRVLESHFTWLDAER
jgi:aminoglycoside phosphotransferase (APT) family kinase protein